MAYSRDKYVSTLMDVSPIYNGLTDTPFRNATALASYLGNYVLAPGKWLGSDVTRLARAGKIEHLCDPSAARKYQQVRVGNRQAQEIKNRKEYFETILRSLPVERSGGGPFTKPASWGDEWFTVTEIAGMLGCHGGTVRKLISDGKLEAEKAEVEPFLIGKDVVVEVTRVHRIKLNQYINRVYHRAER